MWDLILCSGRFALSYKQDVYYSLLILIEGTTCKSPHNKTVIYLADTANDTSLPVDNRFSMKHKEVFVKEKVAIYVRVSTEDQADKQTIQIQLFGCREYANQQGWEVADEFQDEGVSGSVLLEERPAGAQLLKRAEEGAFVRVVVYRYDRLSRDTLGCLLALKRLESLSAPVCSVDEHFGNTPSGHFARTVITAVAELEKNMIRQRTMDGGARKVREGKYMASITPFGYVRENGQILPDPKMPMSSVKCSNGLVKAWG